MQKKNYYLKQNKQSSGINNKNYLQQTKQQISSTETNKKLLKGKAAVQSAGSILLFSSNHNGFEDGFIIERKEGSGEYSVITTTNAVTKS